MPIGKKITSESPIEGVVGFFLNMKQQILNPSQEQENITTKLPDITIDTCLPSDTNIWETGIKRDKIEGKWIIVSQYESTEEAKKGHDEWVKLMTNEPNSKLKDIDMWNIGL
jgi:hypothetical protein